MYLREIELKGFKSFAADTTMELEPVISAIVGPNGSGKSNIVDALRWALGDQSQKNLRVETSSDLIFTGNEFMKGSSSAKVRLLFDDVKIGNSSNCPLDCNTLEIEKIIDNTGKTEYFLNKESSRLKDVVETLASLQLGVKGFSIINQGSIETILKVSPEERTVMLEEILGLRQLEIKKESSERKLNASLLNLDKVRSLENEILPHFRSLKKNVTRFEKQKELKDELEIDEKNYYSIKYKEITKDEVLLKEKISDAQEKISVIEKGIKAEEEKLGFQTNSEKDDTANKFGYLREEINNKIRAKNEEKNKVIYELAKTEGLLENELKRITSTPKQTDPEFALADVSSVISSIGSIRILIREISKCDNILEIKNKISAIEREIERILIKKGEGNQVFVLDNKKEIEELKEKVSGFRDLINLIEKDLNGFYLELEEMKKKEEEHNRNIKNAFSLLEQQQHEKMIALNSLKNLELEEEKIKINLENLRNTITNVSLIWEELVSHSQDFNKEYTREEFNNLENKINRFHRVLNELGFVDDGVMEEFVSVKERLDFLSKEREDLEKAISDLKQVVKELTKQINGQFDLSIKEINKEFNRYLQTLFGGGKGSIEVVQPKVVKKEEDMENGETLADQIINAEEENKSLGVEIKVKLPKSKLDGVEALSGGEKALVSIALLFAIVAQSKPPLLVLDEVDAALDEENARRFGEILKELSGKTQFIIITHNWLTMAASSVIYGITVGKDKCSQILSLQLEESRSFAKN